MHLRSISLISLALAGGTWAVPLDTAESHHIARDSGFAAIMDPPAVSLDKRTVYPTTLLTAAQISAFSPYTQLARAAYCNVASWSCGAACSANPGMVIYATGGNGEDTPQWYVGYLPSLAAAVVAHEGTSPEEIESVLVDADFFFDDLSTAYFPGISSSIKVHNGFTDAHERSAAAIYTAVSNIISQRGVSKVVSVGHSLGGALAILDALSLRLRLGSSISFKVVTYGQPRVGNQAFADYIDTLFTDNTRITNAKDLVPIVPGRFLGFHHSKGEVHIVTAGSNTAWYKCDGQDNEADPYCTTGAVDNILVGDADDHGGPYFGISLGSSQCT